MPTYTVRPGDTLSRIAEKHGMKWEDLYNHPSNSAFKRKRPNPNLIHVGDKIEIPQTRGGKPVPAVSSAVRNSTKYGKFAKYEEAMRAELLKKASSAQQQQIQEEFFKFLEQTKGDWSKAFFIGDRVEDAVKVVNYYKTMKALRLPFRDIVGVVPYITQVKEGDKFIKAVMQPTGKLGKALKVISNTGKVVGVVGLGMQVWAHCGRGDYYAAASEFYKTGIGMGVPWAGLVDAVEGFVSALLGPSKNAKRDERFWKYLKAANIVGLGGAGIDAVGTMLHTMVTGDMDPQRMDRLIKRLRDSPAQVFLEMGEDLNRALTYFENMPEDEFREAMSVGNLYNWIRYELTGKLP